jgi:hypothetical protein
MIHSIEWLLYEKKVRDSVKKQKKSKSSTKKGKKNE